ncbi:MAG: hypothetical protein R3D29_12815 [Nitratireductor sp.]
MLLEADNLVYNNDEDTVAAVGNVRIAYDGYTLVAQRVTYSRRSSVIASGNVEIPEPKGSRILPRKSTSPMTSATGSSPRCGSKQLTTPGLRLKVPSAVMARFPFSTRASTRLASPARNIPSVRPCGKYAPIA